MEYEPGYGLSDSRVNEIRVLDWLLDRATSTDGSFALGELYTGADRDAITHSLRYFESRGWVTLVEVAESHDPIMAMLTPEGRRVASELRERRGNVIERRRASRDALLHWVYEATVNNPGTVPNIAAFTNTSWAYYYGQTFSAEEIAAASNWLADEGYIRGSKSWGGPVIRPTLDPKGERVVEQGRSLNDVSPEPGLTGGGITVAVTGDSNSLQVGSPGASQAVTQTITNDHRQQVLSLADAIEQAAPVLGGQVNDLPSELRTAASQNDPTVLQRVLAKVQSTLIEDGGGALGRSLLAGVSALLGHYGLPQLPLG